MGLLLDFLVWLLAFLLQAALLGLTMYGLIMLSDLENDFVNPHDSSANINKVVLPEYGLEAALTTLLLCSGKWLQGLLHLPIALWDLRTFMRDAHKVDVTEVFRQLQREKIVRIVKLVVYLLLFVFTIFRMVEAAVVGLLSDEGRRNAGQFLQEAASTSHHY